MNKEDITTLQSLLSTPKNIVIIPHRNPDGDAIGSTLAMSMYLKKKGHQTTVLSPNDVAEYLQFMPESKEIIIYEQNIEQGNNILEKAELIFTLDFNAFHRTGEMQVKLSELEVPFVLIDHHELPDSYATILYSDTEIGSTCEMVYNFLESLNDTDLIDQSIATCLYTGITTDSGSFKFPRTTPRTHRIVANLLETGINNTSIHNALYDNSSISRLQLLGRALQNLTVIPERKTTYIYLSQKDLDETQYKKGDTEGIVNYGLTLENICFTAFFTENKDEGIIKISFRSQGDFDVNTFARQHFNGGGHVNAAGGKSIESLEDTITKFKKVIDQYPGLQ